MDFVRVFLEHVAEFCLSNSEKQINKFVYGQSFSVSHNFHLPPIFVIGVVLLVVIVAGITVMSGIGISTFNCLLYSSPLQEPMIVIYTEIIVFINRHTNKPLTTRTVGTLPESLVSHPVLSYVHIIPISVSNIDKPLLISTPISVNKGLLAVIYSFFTTTSRQDFRLGARYCLMITLFLSDC